MSALLTSAPARSAVLDRPLAMRLAAVEDDRFTLAREIARKALNGQLRDRTDGALDFHDRNVSPSWAKKFTRTAQTQRLLFYKPRLEEPLAGAQPRQSASEM